MYVSAKVVKSNLEIIYFLSEKVMKRLAYMEIHEK